MDGIIVEIRYLGTSTPTLGGKSFESLREGEKGKNKKEKGQSSKTRGNKTPSGVNFDTCIFLEDFYHLAQQVTTVSVLKVGIYRFDILIKIMANHNHWMTQIPA